MTCQIVLALDEFTKHCKIIMFTIITQKIHTITQIDMALSSRKPIFKFLYFLCVSFLFVSSGGGGGRYIINGTPIK
jgi:hypothetical protein